MSTAANQPGVFVAPAAGAEVRVHAASIPWYIWTGVVAVTSSSIGGAWDVSWHRSIGRDTFWTPAHMAIYACGVLAGIICGWLIGKIDLRRDPRALGCVGERFWTPRSAGYLSRRLGLCRGAHLGSVRQLVA